MAGHAVRITDLRLKTAILNLTFFAPPTTGEIIDLELTNQRPLALAVLTTSLGLPVIVGHFAAHALADAAGLLAAAAVDGVDGRLQYRAGVAVGIKSQRIRG